jgi:hypothetical protein
MYVRWFVFKERVWPRVRNFVQFLHMSGFALQQWSVSHPDPMQPWMVIAAPLSPPSIEDDKAMKVGPVAAIQKKKALHSRDLCRIISAFIYMLRGRVG